MKQRSKEWYNVRLGRFTASDIVKLLGKETLKTTQTSIDTYAFEKAVESLYGIDEDENFISSDMQRGIDLEPIAFEKFKNEKAFKFLEVKEAHFFPFGEHAGASPDGLVGEDSVLEIKCPKPKKFFKLVANGVSEIDEKYIAQMQMQMLCTNSKRCYFYNYIIHNGIEHSLELVIERDEEMISLIKERIEKAVKIKKDYLTKLKANALVVNL